jgi:hypothetical protein
MIQRAVLAYGLFGVLSISCSSTSGSASPDSGAPPGTGAASLVGTWNLTTTAPGGGSVPTTVTIGQDSLTVSSPSFTLTAVRTGSALAFTDTDSYSHAADVLTATQTAGTFNAGIVPFDLSGSWTMQGGAKGGSPTVTCTLNVTAGEVDGACQELSPPGSWFSFTTQKTSAAASSFGDFGGKWTNTWTWPGTGGGVFPCTLDFSGNTITTCAGGATDGEITGSPLAGIMFTYDGANTVSGAAQGWAEFSATR